MGYPEVKASVGRRVEWARSLKANPCEECGNILPPERMHWHHRDPTTKLFTIGQVGTRVGRKRLLEEIAKCELLCEDCHRDHHRTQKACGTQLAYKAGCRCNECRNAHRIATQIYRKERG